MSANWINEAKVKMAAFFSSSTDEEFLAALKNAGLEEYSDAHNNILDEIRSVVYPFHDQMNLGSKKHKKQAFSYRVIETSRHIAVATSIPKTELAMAA